MGERPHRDNVDARLRYLANAGQGDAATCLHQRAAPYLGHGRSELGGGEVVEQDGAGARAECGFNLLRVIYFQFYVRNVRKLDAQGAHSSGYVSHAIGGKNGEMVFFDHDCIGKRVPMIVTASTANRMAFDEAEPRRGLSRVYDAGPGSCNGGYVLSSERSDARHPLHEVESYAFCLQNSLCRTLDGGEDGGLRETLTVGQREAGANGRIG